MKKQDLLEHHLWERDDAIEIRLWASYRGQTLARTVRGMMYYQRCVFLNILKFLGFLYIIEAIPQKHQIRLNHEKTNGQVG
jgi:hypothetical protein